MKLAGDKLVGRLPRGVDAEPMGFTSLPFVVRSVEPGA